MTFLALTIPPDHSQIVVSADQGLAPTRARDDIPSGDPYTAPGLGAAPVPPARLVGKVLRKGDLVLAGLGAYGVLVRGVEAIERAGVEDIDKAIDINFDFTEIPPSVLFLLGRSARLGRLAAFMATAPDYQFAELLCGHTLHPTPCTDLDDYDRIFDIWASAAHGEATEAFHMAVATNVRRAWLERRLREPAAFGGDLQMLTLSDEGIVEREAAGFWH